MFSSTREALSWTKGQSCEDIIVEADYLVVVQEIRSDTRLLSYFDRVIQECKKSGGGVKGKQVTLKFVKRSANRVTYYLARYNNSTIRLIVV